MAFSYSPKIVTDGLVLYLDAANTRSYPGTGTIVNDLSRNAYTASLVNGPTYGSTFNGCILLDAADDRIAIPSFETIVNGTISIWVRNNNEITTGSTPTPIFELTNGVTLNNDSLTAVFGNVATAANRVELFSLYVNANLTFPSGGAATYVAANLPITGSTIPVSWHNIAVARDAAGTRVYFNGTLLGGASQGNDVRSITTTTTPFITGSWTNNKFGRVLNGSFSNGMIYNRALTTAEIRQNYNTMRVRFGV